MGASESGATERKQPTTREGRRMSALASAYSSAIKYAMRGVDEEEFATQFPDASPELLEILWQGYRQALHGSRVHIESDFDTLCEEAALPDKLHQLEELCQVQGVARGAGDLTADASAQPTLAVRAALLAARKAEVEQLEAILSVVAKAREEESRKLEERLAQVQEACRRLGPLAALDTNVSRACLMWENHKSGPATLA